MARFPLDETLMFGCASLIKHYRIYSASSIVIMASISYIYNNTYQI